MPLVLAELFVFLMTTLVVATVVMLAVAFVFLVYAILRLLWKM